MRSHKTKPFIKRILRTLAILLLLQLVMQPVAQPVLAHKNVRYHVIIDTDGSTDDLRAICLMLASPHVEVIAITVVGGALEAEEAACKVRFLLGHFGHQGIPVGMEELIPRSIELEEMPVDIVALGPLTSLAAALRQEPGIPELVRDVYWYNNAFDSLPAGEVLASGFSICRVNAGGHTFEFTDAAFLESLDTIPSRYAAMFGKLCSTELPGDDMIAHPEYDTTAHPGHNMAAHLKAEIVPIFLLHQEHFSVSINKMDPDQRLAVALPSLPPEQTILAVLDSDREDKSIVFNRFPVDPGLFEQDVAELVPRLIEQHGLKEWKIVIMTNEFHEHLGIYSIIGAKMGLRAREYFNIGLDEFRIVSYAGSQPPLSCMNDGLQVSTGSTLGHGTISLGTGQPFPKALFHFKNRTIEITLREDVRDTIRKEVHRGVQEYGLESPEYWDYIRKKALIYWMELNRHEIFEITELQPVS